MSASKPQRSRWVFPGVASAILLFGFTLCRRAIILSDEGYLLSQALDMVQGKILYRDMDAFVAPGVWFLLAGLFSVVEPSVLASRLLALAGYATMMGVAYRIVAIQVGARAGLAALGALVVVTVWAFPAWTWSFYSPYAVLLALAALERLLAWRRSRRPGDLVGVGALLGLALIFKQNYGALAALGAAAGWLAIRLEARETPAAVARSAPGDSARVAAGLALVGLPVLAYFAWHGALPHAFDALVVHPFGGFLGTHDIPYLSTAELWDRDRFAGVGKLTYGAYAFIHTSLRFDWASFLVRGVEQLHVLLYWLPPLIFAAGLLAALRPPTTARPLDAGLFATVAVCGAVFLGVFPRADFNHLINVYQPVVVAAAVVVPRLLERMSAPRPRWLHACSAAGLALLAMYTIVAGSWYFDLLTRMNSRIDQKRGGVLVGAEEQAMIDFEVNAIRAETREGEAILTLPGFAMFNFLADRPMPSRYYNLYAVHIAHDEGAGVVRGAEASRVRLVVADFNDFFSERVALRDYAPQLTDYLRRHFRPAFSVAVDEHLFLRRRHSPLPALEGESALGDCDLPPDAWDVKRGVADHLLFRSLYHYLGRDRRGDGDEGGAADERLETRCSVVVPPDATLAVQLGYRQPTAVEAGSTLRAELWVLDSSLQAGSNVRLLDETFIPAPATSWVSPPPRAFRFDLSRFGGRRVTLLFRTRFQGRVEMNPFDFTGFAMVWQDPRLEYPGSGGGARPPLAER